MLYSKKTSPPQFVSMVLKIINHEQARSEHMT
jgi:hypothetical protein